LYAEGFLAATEFTNLFDIVERIAGKSAARTAESVCLNVAIHKARQIV